MNLVYPRPGLHSHTGRWRTMYSTRSTCDRVRHDEHWIAREPNIPVPTGRSRSSGMESRWPPACRPSDPVPRRFEGCSSLPTAPRSNTGFRPRERLPGAVVTESTWENNACFPGMSSPSGLRGPSSCRSAGAQNRARLPRGSGASDTGARPSSGGCLSGPHADRRRADGRWRDRPRRRASSARAAGC
jgi:hypothetical protein